MAAPIVELRDVTKQYVGVTAVAELSLRLHAGEVLCLLGENGAGKSTVIKILTGVETPTAGEVLVDGEPVRFSSPRDAREKGIATVYQEVGTLPHDERRAQFRARRRTAKGARALPPARSRRSVAHCAYKACAISALVASPMANQLVGTLSGGERQALAIGRAIYFGARVLVLDEPTAALGVRESATVLKLIDKVRARGVAVLFITHNAYHAYASGDRFMILRRGEALAEFNRDRANNRRGDRTDGRRRGAEVSAERRRTRRGEPIGRLVHRPVAGDRPAPELPRRRRCDHIGRDR